MLISHMSRGPCRLGLVRLGAGGGFRHLKLDVLPTHKQPYRSFFHCSLSTIRCATERLSCDDMASTYTLSRPILQELQSRSNTQGTLRPPPGESHTAYLDHSLAILGSEILSQNKQLDTAFAQQCDYVRNANQEAYRGQIQRDGTIIEKLNDLDRVYSEWFQKIDERFQQTVERFQQIDNTQGARQRNAIKVRPHYTIERVPHVQHGIARWADEEIHPKTVKIFWQMGHQRKQSKLLA